MDLNDLYKLAGIQKNDTPAIEPTEVSEQPMGDREQMQAMIALVSPELLNKLQGTTEVEEVVSDPGGQGEGYANSGAEMGYDGKAREVKPNDTAGDTSLRRYLGAMGDHVSIDETIYPDHTIDSVSEAYTDFKKNSEIDEAHACGCDDSCACGGNCGPDCNCHSGCSNEVATESKNLHNTDWPTDEMRQHAENAVRHGFTPSDSIDHIFSMAHPEEQEWIKHNMDDLEEMFAQYEVDDEDVKESEERPYICVHAKKGKHECHASSSYGAAQKAAKHWGLKSTAGIDAHLAVEEAVEEDFTPMTKCPDCDGDGEVEVETYRPQSFSRDIGEIDSRMETCETCNGDGEVEDEDYDWDQMEEADVEEGNKFSLELKKAKDANQDEFKVDGKTYKVTEAEGEMYDDDEQLMIRWSTDDGETWNLEAYNRNDQYVPLSQEEEMRYIDQIRDEEEDRQTMSADDAAHAMRDTMRMDDDINMLRKLAGV